MTGTDDRAMQGGLNLWLPLKNPAQIMDLLALIQQAKAERIFPKLKDLQDVHFARFLPSHDGSTLWVITTYDGRLDDYIMDFVAVIGDIFTDVLQFIAGAPPLPVNRYPREFLAFVKAHHIETGVWSAYPDATVLDIQRALEATT
jgi:hypothetical protein